MCQKMIRRAFYIGLLISVTIGILSPSDAYPEPPHRIVSLAPNITEILFALGLEERIAGVTSFCDYPARAMEKPRVGGMSNPSLESVVSLRPDMVVFTTDGNPKELEERVRELGIKTYVFTARRVSELPDGIRELGRALESDRVADALASRIEAAISRYNKLANPMHGRKALFIIWPEPLIVAGPGTAIDDALNLLGLKNIASDADTQYPRYSIEEVILRSPDIIFIGKGHKDMRTLSEGILQRLANTSAMKNGRVYFITDALYRLGPRVLDGLRELSAILEDGGKIKEMID